MREEPFHTEYRIARFSEFKKNAITEADDEKLPLASFKCQEYRLRLLSRWPDRLLEELPRLYLARSGKANILESALRWRRGQKQDPFRKSKWTPAEIKRRINGSGGLALPLGDHLTDLKLCKYLRLELIRYAEDGLMELAKRPPATDDVLGERMRQLRESFRLTALDEEILLYGYLVTTDPQVAVIHEKVKCWWRVVDGQIFKGDDIKMNTAVLAVIIGCSLADLAAALSPDGALRIHGLLKAKCDLSKRVIEFLNIGLGAILPEPDC